MLVNELIQRLQAMPPDAEITIQQNGWHNFDIWTLDMLVDYGDDGVILFIKDAG